MATVMPYRDTDEAIELARLGKGSLAGSLFTLFLLPSLLQFTPRMRQAPVAQPAMAPD